MTRKRHSNINQTNYYVGGTLGDSKYRPKKYQPKQPDPGTGRTVAILCLICLLLGVGVATGAIYLQPYVSGLDVTSGDSGTITVPNVDLNDVPVDTIKRYVNDNKYLFPEFFPDVQKMINELKPQVPIQELQKEKTSEAVKVNNKTSVKEVRLDMLTGKGRFKTFRISYLKEYFPKLVGVKKFAPTKIGYIVNLETEQTPDCVLVSFDTPKAKNIVAALRPDGTVHWDSSVTTQLDVEKALQIIVDATK